MLTDFSAALAPLLIFGIFEQLLGGSSLVPPYLIVFVLALVVLTGATAFVRLAVYQRLVSLNRRVRRLVDGDPKASKPKVVLALEGRLQTTGVDVDRLNTAALVDRAYSQFLSNLEYLNYFCRVLPNLLLALGLLGTFLGITLNLNQLSQTINDFGIGSIDDLVAQVQKPLQGMGIAFVSSLTAVFCSALLTAINLLRNTGVVKYQLLSALEDYLDNVYLPSLGRQTTFDRVETLAQDFLNRFGRVVTNAVEASLGDKVAQMNDRNRQSNELAQQVYRHFLEASESMSSGAKVFRESAEIFDRADFADKLANSTHDLASHQRSLAQAAQVLNQSSQSIQLALNLLQSSSQETIALGDEIRQLNQQSARVLETTQENQQSFSAIASQLHQSAQVYQAVIRNLDRMQKRMADRAENLTDARGEFIKAIAALREHTTEVAAGMQELGDRLAGGLPQREAQGQPMADRMSQLSRDLAEMQAQLDRLSDSE